MSCDPAVPSTAVCALSECACGHLTLTVGRVRIDMSRTEFAELYRILSEAVCRLGIESTGAESPPVKAVMH